MRYFRLIVLLIFLTVAGSVIAGPSWACGSPPNPRSDWSGYKSWCSCQGGTVYNNSNGMGCDVRRVRRPPPRRHEEIYTGPTEEEIHELRQKEVIKRGEKTYKPLYKKWEREKNLDAVNKQTKESQHRLRQQREGASAAVRVEMGNNWNDAGISAYRNGGAGAALQYFRAAATYMGNDKDIQRNLRKAELKITQQAREYLKSVGTALMIKSLSPKALLFHPDPNIRMHAQKELAKESMKKIAEASTVFVLNEHLNRGKLERFRWENEAEREKRKRLAKQHALLVEELKLKAFDEAHRKAMALQVVNLTGGRAIKFENGPAMRRLIELSQSGFE